MVLQHRVPFLLSPPHHPPTVSRRPLVGLPCEALRSHSDTPHSVGLLWTCNRSVRRTVPDNTQISQETSNLPVGFEPAIPANERPQTHATNLSATGLELFFFHLTIHNHPCSDFRWFYYELTWIKHWFLFQNRIWQGASLWVVQYCEWRPVVAAAGKIMGERG